MKKGVFQTGVFHQKFIIKEFRVQESYAIQWKYDLRKAWCKIDLYAATQRKRDIIDTL